MLVILWSVFTLTIISQGARIFEPCELSSDCPNHAVCAPKACDGYVCICEENRFPNEDKDSCLRDALLGQLCDATILCRAPMSRCDGKSCKCPSSFTAASDSLCKVIGTSLLGEPCNSSTPCSNTYELECRDETCQCRTGGNIQLRPATDRERLAQPTLVLQCRPVGFSLDKCDGVNILPPDESSSTQSNSHHSFTSMIVTIASSVSDMQHSFSDSVSSIEATVGSYLNSRDVTTTISVITESASMSSYSDNGITSIALISSGEVTHIHLSLTELPSSISYESDSEINTPFATTTLNPSSANSFSSSSETLSENNLILPSSSVHMSSSHITNTPDINKELSTEQIDIPRAIDPSSSTLTSGNIDDSSSKLTADTISISSSEIISSTIFYSSSPDKSTIENNVSSESTVSLTENSASIVSTIIPTSASSDAVGSPTKPIDGVLQLESTKSGSGTFDLIIIMLVMTTIIIVIIIIFAVTATLGHHYKKEILL